jgi:hypothetical protein
MSFYTSLMQVEGRIASIVLIFSGLASIPQYETRKPSNLPGMTSKTHLFGFNFMRIECNLVETGVVDAHPKIPTSHGDDNRVGEPPRVVDLPDKADVKQLFDLSTDEVLPLNGLLLRLLLDRSGVKVDLQIMLNHLPRDLEYLGWLPGKHVNVSPEEDDEREFLFVVQVPRDASGLGSINPDLNSLHGDSLIVGGLHAGCRG